MRQSVRSLAASENQSLNESALVDAIASYVQGQRRQGPASTVSQSIDGEVNPNKLKALGEEMIIDKISRIFDEAKRDGDQQ